MPGALSPGFHFSTNTTIPLTIVDNSADIAAVLREIKAVLVA